jgi:hypothetical protein
MRKIFFFIAMLLMAPFFMQAQHVEITPFGGYVFPVTWHASNGSIYFNGNAQYGGMIGVGISRSVDVELMYNRIDTKAYPSMVGYSFDEVPLSVNYFMGGFVKNFRVNDIVSPYLGFNLGACLMDPKLDDYYSYWFFSFGAEGGVKIYFSKYVGLRLQAQMLVPVQGGGFYFYGGSGYGGTAVTVSSTLVDFGFTGGLIFRIGRY